MSIIDKNFRIISDDEALLEEASELMDNIHAYNSEIFGKIGATLEGMSNGKSYSDNFIEGLLSDAMYLFERTNSEETKVYLKLEKRLG